jgi:hypothetical protein
MERSTMRYVAEAEYPDQGEPPSVITLRAVGDDYRLDLNEVEIPTATVKGLELTSDVGGPEDDGLTLFPGDHGFKTLAKLFEG